MTLRECVNTKFELVNKAADDSKAVLEWLEEALSIKADDEAIEWMDKIIEDDPNDGEKWCLRPWASS